MAALVGARLASQLRETIFTSNVIFWSDSQIVLHWLTTTKPLKRLYGIVQRKSTSWQSGRHGDTVLQMTTQPTYSHVEYQRIPTLKISYRTPVLHGIGTKNSGLPGNIISQWYRRQTTTVSSLQCTEIPGVQRVVNLQKYSTYLKLLRITAYVWRFINNCRRQRADRVNGSLTTSELHNAEVKWLRSCQATHFQNKIENMTTNSTSSRLPLVKQLRLYLDPEGIIRCGGRIHNAPLEDAAKFPYLLLKKHELNKLIVFDTYENQLHYRLNATITKLRQKYWTPSIRQCVRSLLRTCVKCIRAIGRPYLAPDPPTLPKVRVEQALPFSVTGVDFTGTLYVKNTTGSETKCYICLFICATTRAVHLEVVPNLSTDSFLQAFRRFTSRKSLSEVMISDNATTYIAAANHLKKLFNSPAVQEGLSRRRTEWRFIPKRAPWYDGFLERLIGLTKTFWKRFLEEDSWPWKPCRRSWQKLRRLWMTDRLRMYPQTLTIWSR